MRNQGGFTLIELMITVAVVAILASVAYPSYIDYINRAHRQEAKTALMKAAQQMERYYSIHNCYPSNSANCGTASSSAAALTAASIPSYSGDTSAASYYTLSVTTNAQDFTLTATPVKSDSKCGNFTLSNTNAKGATGSQGSTTCWQK